MMVKTTFHGCLVAALTCALAASALAQQVDAGLDDVYDPASESTKLLGTEFKDEAVGFRIAPPAHARVISRAGLEFMTFIHDGKQWGGNLQGVTVANEMSIEDYLKSSSAELAKTFRGTQVIDSRTLEFRGKKAGRLTTRMEEDVVPLSERANPRAKKTRISVLRQQLVLQMSPRAFWVLTFYTPLKDQAVAQKTFEAMINSFEFLDREKLRERRVNAVLAGKKWLAQRKAEELKDKLYTHPQLFAIKIENADIGYVQFDEKEDRRLDNFRGIVVNINSRTFPADGSFVLGSNEAFWAYTKDEFTGPDGRQHFSMWHNNSKRSLKRIPTKEDPRQWDEFWLSELGTLKYEPASRLPQSALEILKREREEMLKKPDLERNRIPPPLDMGENLYLMNVTRTGDKSQELTNDNKAVHIPIRESMLPDPLPKVLEYLWPRVVDLSKPSEMAFTVYNHHTAKLALRMLSVKGPAVISLDGKRVECIRLTDELDPGMTTLWVDKQGKILMMRTSDQSLLVPSTQERLQQLWGKRLERLR